MSSLELRVELPTHSYSFRIQAQLQWTVHDVKAEIKRVCPGSPKVDGQRVIWRGRLLRDEELVMDIWKTADDARTVHLSVHPSAWTGTAPAVPQSAPAHTTSQPSQIPIRHAVRHTGYPEPAPSVALYIVKRHTDALHVLTQGYLPLPTSDNSIAVRNLAVGAVQAAGWSWPPVFDESYPAPSQSTEGVKYEQVTLENQQYLKLSNPDATPTPMQQHALRVLSHTFPLLSVSLYPQPMWTPMAPYPMQYPLAQPTADLNQHLQRLGLPQMRLAPHQNPNQNPNDPNNAVLAAEIRAIPMRALMMPLIMLVVRTFILMYFFSPSKRPVFGILLSLYIIYETWGALRAIIANDRPGDAPAAREPPVAAANNQARAAPGQPRARGADGSPVVPRRASDMLLTYLANVDIRRQDRVLNTELPAPEPSLFHKATAFVRLFVLSLHPAFWDRRRTALRRREGRLRTEISAREAAPPAPTTAPAEGAEGENGGGGENTSAQDASRAQARAQLIARHERRPMWVRSYVDRVQNAEWADDA